MTTAISSATLEMMIVNDENAFTPSQFQTLKLTLKYYTGTNGKTV